MRHSTRTPCSLLVVLLDLGGCEICLFWVSLSYSPALVRPGCNKNDSVSARVHNDMDPALHPTTSVQNHGVRRV